MDIIDQSSDNPFGVIVNVSDKTPTSAEPAAYLPPRYFDDNIVSENDYIPITSPITGETIPVRAYNSGDPNQKRVRLSSAVDENSFPRGASQASIDFNPDNRQQADDGLPPNLAEYKQFLIERIAKGAQDLTYGPGSPSPTGADMREYVGSHDNKLVTGHVALSPSDYNLFSPQERAMLGIDDVRGQPNTEGAIERYYGPEARGQNIHDIIDTYPKIAGDVTGQAIGAAGNVMPRLIAKDKNGNSMWSDGSRVFSDGTVATPMGSMMKFTSTDGKVKWTSIDPQKQPIPDIPSDITPDGTDEQKDTAVSKLSPTDRVAVREYASGKRSPMTLRGRVDPSYTRLAPYVHLLNKDYDPSEFPLKQQTRMEYATAKVNTPGGQVRSFNQAIMHTGNLWDLMQKLPGDDSRAINEFKNVVSKYIKGEPYVTDAEQQLGFVVNEIGRALKGSAIDQGDINRMLTNIGVASSRSQIESNIKNVLLKTIEGGMESLDGAYKGVMNEDLPTKKIIYPETAAALRKIGVTDFVHRPLGEGPATTTSRTYPQPVPKAVQHLKDNPSSRDEYDQKFGPGASDKVLGPSE